MHPKEYLRKNNTGKLLWQVPANLPALPEGGVVVADMALFVCQVLGEEHAKLCLSGLAEQEAAMWQALKEAGRKSVWCVYPARSPNDTWVPKMDLPGRSREGEEAVQEEGGGGGLARCTLCLWTGRGQTRRRSSTDCRSGPQEVPHPRPARSLTPCGENGRTGTCQQGVGRWGHDMCRTLARRPLSHAHPQVTLPSPGAECEVWMPISPPSPHPRRPQPQKDRICTAGAASTLLRELSQRGELDGMGLGEAADAVDDAIGTLLGALGKRRIRNGRSTLRLSGGRNKVYQGY